MAKNNELALVTYAVENVNIADIKDVLAEAAGASGITPQDLDKITIPAGGAQVWTVPTLEGEASMKAVEGIIIHHQDARAYWATAVEESGGAIPPDCSSNDALLGQGKPGGVCSKCPLANFGSDKKGRGQACKSMKIIFLLMPDTLLPMMMPMPPTSIKVIKQYLLRLASRGIKASQVVTSLSLTKEKNLDGVQYSRVAASMVKKLDDATAEKIKAYAKSFKSALGQISVEDVGEA